LQEEDCPRDDQRRGEVERVEVGFVGLRNTGFPQGFIHRVPLHPDGAQRGEDLLQIAPVAYLDLAGKEVEGQFAHPGDPSQCCSDLLFLVRAIHRGDEDPRYGGLPVGIHKSHITGRYGGRCAARPSRRVCSRSSQERPCF
jgi:hypothetical protein